MVRKSVKNCRYANIYNLFYKIRMPTWNHKTNYKHFEILTGTDNNL